jgi:vacuolar-type H+-ATPase subunit F/Vma7
MAVHSDRVSGRLAAIGEASLIRGYALAGVAVTVAEDAEAVRCAWQALESDVTVVILTEAAARALRDITGSPARITAILPGAGAP